MQGTCSNSSSVFLSVVDVEVVETATSFLACLDTWWHSDFSDDKCST